MDQDLFRRFFFIVFERRVKGRNSGGHGLGLAFVDAVARAHGGSVAASNREGGGARIAITLPASPEPKSHSPLLARSSSN